jgi:hypothetical protein
VRRLAIVGVTLLAAATAWWATRQAVPAGPGPQAARPPVPRATPASLAHEPRPARDPFAYADAPRLAEEPAFEPVERPEPLLPPPPPPPPPLRLSGLVERGGRLEAVLARDGEVALAAVGEAAFGFTVVELDPVAGVLLRDGSGATLRLRAER